MSSRLQWIHGRGQRIIVERDRTPEILVKFIVLVGLLYLATRILYWGEWVAFAGASVYLLWELGRINSTLAARADIRAGSGNEQEEPCST
ncbi:hypothetical protein [Streptomyces sp. NBC_00286]|uniref:hypothetical protein n=1 Tax=Streptomyces sp. NBC_00286 TaxID=2975701 RepID=UPI002E29AB5C|nr:hypothetical protein [Streptomyces sp. NBC_00286]